MKPKYKLGQKIRLIGNTAGSEFKRGQIGFIHGIESSDSYLSKDVDGAVYLIRDTHGYYDPGGTWSYACDLSPLIEKLNNNTKTL